MEQESYPYNYIVIEGNIGAGKTTLCKMLADDLNCQLILEQFSDNPFLPLFYENPERYAFTVELFFMSERHKQLQEHFMQPSLFEHITIADYFFIKTLLFAKQNLPDEEYRLFQRLFKVLNASFAKPDLLLFLHRPIENLLVNIEKRGRAYERDITPDYLEKVSNAYFDYFRSETAFPILLINATELDFVNNSESFDFIKELLTQKHKPGLNHISLIT